MGHWWRAIDSALFTAPCPAFMLNHSPEYKIAMAAAVVEFAVECVWFPGMKQFTAPYWVGLCVAIAGLAIRAVAMWTAGHAFTHIIVTVRR